MGYWWIKISLTAGIDCMVDEQNRSLFLHSKAAYLDELKNYYLRYKDEWIQIFLDFERGEYKNIGDVSKISNYIFGHLISWSPNWSYFEC